MLDANGRSLSAYLNGSPVTVQQICEVAERLSSTFMASNAHQSLLKWRAAAIAGFSCATWRIGRAGRRSLAAWREAKGGWVPRWRAEALLVNATSLSGRSASSIRSVFASMNVESLNIEHKRLAHAASLQRALFKRRCCPRTDAACETLLDQPGIKVDGLTGFDPALLEVSALLRSAQTELTEAVSVLHRYADRLDLDPDRLGDVERRIEAVLSCAWSPR